ncbi:MAG: carbohydrate ABC transporter permease [Saccharofermentanales bacterium]
MKFSKRRIFRFIFNVFRFVFLMGLAFMILYPVFIKFSQSILSIADKSDPTVIFYPKNPTFNNYKIIWNAINYPATLLFTTGFILGQSIIQALSCALAAYGLARYNVRGKNIIFMCIMLTLIIPPQVILTPLFLRFKYFGLLNIFKFSGNLSGIDLTNTILPFLFLSITSVAFKNGLYIFLLRQYFKGLPETLEEAAYIDGCGHFRTFFKIMLPGAVPMLITILLFAFVWQWNDQYYATLAPNLPLLINKIFNMTSLSADQMGDAILQALLENAKLMLIIFPLIILYIGAQNFFTESIERSGITG